MARETTYRGIWGDWQGLLTKLEANLGESPQIEPFRLKLVAILAQVLGISRQQDAMRASKQEASKQLRQLMAEGSRVAAVMRVVIKDHYGPREEKIAEFGLQPFRGRKAKPAPQAPAPGQPETPALPAPSEPKP
jgi:hypothetical protein